MDIHDPTGLTPAAFFRRYVQRIKDQVAAHGGPTSGEVVVLEHLAEHPYSLEEYEQRFEEMAARHAAWMNLFFVGIYEDRYFVLCTETQCDEARQLFSMPTRPPFINTVAVEWRSDWSVSGLSYSALDRRRALTKLRDSR